jgi:hypothetical protein
MSTIYGQQAWNTARRIFTCTSLQIYLPQQWNKEKQVAAILPGRFAFVAACFTTFGSGASLLPLVTLNAGGVHCGAADLHAGEELVRKHQHRLEGEASRAYIEEVFQTASDCVHTLWFQLMTSLQRVWGCHCLGIPERTQDKECSIHAFFDSSFFF